MEYYLLIAFFRSSAIIFISKSFYLSVYLVKLVGCIINESVSPYITDTPPLADTMSLAFWRAYLPILVIKAAIGLE